MKQFAFLAALAALCPSLALAENNCAPRGALIERLTQQYGETRHAIGLAGQQQVMELWGSVETGTWTIVITLPDGRTCLAASGAALELMTENLPPQGNPA